MKINHLQYQEYLQREAEAETVIQYQNLLLDNSKDKSELPRLILFLIKLIKFDKKCTDFIERKRAAVKF